MIHVYEIPEKRSNGFCFGAGKPITFLNIDWMNSPDEIPGIDPMTDEEIVEFIKAKMYIKSDRQYLILFEDRAFVI